MEMFKSFSSIELKLVFHFKEKSLCFFFLVSANPEIIVPISSNVFLTFVERESSMEVRNQDERTDIVFRNCVFSVFHE